MAITPLLLQNPLRSLSKINFFYLFSMIIFLNTYFNNTYNLENYKVESAKSGEIITAFSNDAHENFVHHDESTDPWAQFEEDEETLFDEKEFSMFEAELEDFLEILKHAGLNFEWRVFIFYILALLFILIG